MVAILSACWRFLRHLFGFQSQAISESSVELEIPDELESTSTAQDSFDLDQTIKDLTMSQDEINAYASPENLVVILKQSIVSLLKQIDEFKSPL